MGNFLCQCKGGGERGDDNDDDDDDENGDDGSGGGGGGRDSSMAKMLAMILQARKRLRGDVALAPAARPTKRGRLEKGNCECWP